MLLLGEEQPTTSHDLYEDTQNLRGNIIMYDYHCSINSHASAALDVPYLSLVFSSSACVLGPRSYLNLSTSFFLADNLSEVSTNDGDCRWMNHRMTHATRVNAPAQRRNAAVCGGEFRPWKLCRACHCPWLRNCAMLSELGAHCTALALRSSVYLCLTCLTASES